MRNFITIMNRTGILFSTKKVKQPSIMKVSRFKLDDKIGGHLIYRTELFNSLFTVASGNIAGISVLCFAVYANPTLYVILPLIMITSASIGYQWRLSKTIK
jgi:hypothetical protein